MKDIENKIAQEGNYQFIRPCSNNLFIVGTPLRDTEWFKMGVVDSSCNIIIPMSYISIIEEIGRYFRVRRVTDDKTAMLDFNGKEVIDFGKYAFGWSFWGSYIKVKKDRCYGLLDKDLNVALPCIYNDMFLCVDGAHINCYGIKENRTDKWRFLDNQTLSSRF